MLRSIKDIRRERKAAVIAGVREAFEQSPRGADCVVLFGSYATDQFHGRSDLDILVIGDGVPKYRPMPFWTRDLDVVPITAADLEHALLNGSRFYRQILDEGIVVYGTLPEPVRAAWQEQGQGQKRTVAAE